ncbi:MAG: hypothetical protein HFI11_12390 [Lachnospiraceae bacterium]|nr:hypothetical protein [Lachnospiraceae bacterium]
MTKEQQQKAAYLAQEVLRLSRDSIIMNMRFLDAALSAMRPVSQPGLKGVAADGESFRYDDAFVLRRYKGEPAYIARCCLHSLLHLVFYHPFRYGEVETKYWDIAADIAVENVILEMDLHFLKIHRDTERKAEGAALKIKCGALTAEKIYRYLMKEKPDEEELAGLKLLFHRDEHLYWVQPQQMEVSLAQWKKISERIRTDLKTFSKGKFSGEKGNGDSLEKNLAEAVKDRYDYGDILRRFMVTGEEIHPNDEEFDYIYYTYGLEHYGNMPLVEPLEYKDIKKVKEFVIAIDTSASCRGKIVRGFLNRTYSIMKSAENFFSKVNVHIIQCDNEVQSDVKITCDQDFEEYIRTGKLTGFGATDFRPVFAYVDELAEQGAFENLKGLIYFTDGYGVYPERMPAYDVIFAFLNEDERRPAVPCWALPVVLEEEELEDTDERGSETDV